VVIFFNFLGDIKNKGKRRQNLKFCPSGFDAQRRRLTAKPNVAHFLFLQSHIHVDKVVCYAADNVLFS
jgi:hypothetical protein